MFRKSSIMMFVLLLSVVSMSFAQRGGRGRAPDVFLLDREAAAEFLGIVESQESGFNKEIDELTKIYESYLKESTELAETLGLPETVVTAGLGFGGRRGGRGRGGGGGGGDFQALLESYRTYIVEDNKLRKKYEDKEDDLQEHLDNIEEMLTEDQQEKFNYTRPQRGGRRGGGRRGGGGGGGRRGGGGGGRGGGGGGFQQQLIKPSFEERQSGFGR